jgi:hypothetical protein
MYLYLTIVKLYNSKPKHDICKSQANMRLNRVNASVSKNMFLKENSAM